MNTDDLEDRLLARCHRWMLGKPAELGVFAPSLSLGLSRHRRGRKGNEARASLALAEHAVLTDKSKGRAVPLAADQ